MHHVTGFTLIELLIVVVIVAIVGTFGTVISLNFYRTYSFNQDSDALVGALQTARARAMANYDGVPWGVRIDVSDIYIFFGIEYAHGNSSNQLMHTSSRKYNGINQVLFEQLSGNVRNAGSIGITDGVRNAIITINSQGQIN